jgi:hypothetical protein
MKLHSQKSWMHYFKNRLKLNQTYHPLREMNMLFLVHDFGMFYKHHLGSSTSKILHLQYQQTEHVPHGAISTTTRKKLVQLVSKS